MRRLIFLLSVTLLASNCIMAQTIENINGVDVIVKPADTTGIRKGYNSALNKLKQDRALYAAHSNRLKHWKAITDADSVKTQKTHFHYDRKVRRNIKLMRDSAGVAISNDKVDSAIWVAALKTLKK